MTSVHDNNSSHDSLHGQRVCVTGRLAAMTHAELAELVSACGGEFLDYPIKAGFLLVIGADGWPVNRDGSPSLHFERARRLRALGYPIEFLSEEAFFERIGLAAPAGSLHGRHTIADLSRLLGVSAASLRRWERMGLIRPIESVHRFSYFDFSEVASARRLCELVAEGASLSGIRQGLEKFRTWLPTADVSFSQLAHLEQNGQLALRLHHLLVEVNRQQRFDFEDGGDSPESLELPARPAANSTQLDEWFDRGLALEDQGRFEEAADAYREAIRIDAGDAAVHFNLGNVLFALRCYREARTSFGESLRCDPEYAEAWNNFGNACSELGERREAVRAYRRAVELVPGYEDARHNLTLLLSAPSRAALRVVS